MSIGNEIGKLIKEERIKQGISAFSLAKRAGVTARAITYWENGDRENLHIEGVDRVLKELGVSFVLGKERK